MGIQKRRLEEEESLRDEARDILTQVDILEECKYHEGEYYCIGNDLESAYKLANYKISNGNIELPSHVSRKDFSNIINSVYSDYCLIEECGYCKSAMGD